MARTIHRLPYAVNNGFTTDLTGRYKARIGLHWHVGEGVPKT